MGSARDSSPDPNRASGSARPTLPEWLRPLPFATPEFMPRLVRHHPPPSNVHVILTGIQPFRSYVDP